MSRDWTPREMYEVEQDNIKNGRDSIWDFYENSTWTIGDESWPLCPAEELAQRKENPTLGRLYNSYADVYALSAKTLGGLDFLAAQDKLLEAYISTGQGNKTSPLIKWFEGKLDPHFYYSTRNDELLFEHFKEELEHLQEQSKKPSLISRIQEAIAKKESVKENPCTVYLFPAEERTWSVEISSTPSKENAVSIAVEGSYPVELIYDRVDMNGSRNLDSIRCENRKDLVESLNWVGKCRFPTFSFWNFDSNRTDNEKATAILSDAYSYRHKLLMEDMEEMFGIEPPKKIKPETRER